MNSCWLVTRNQNPEPNVAPVIPPVPKASIPFPSRRNDERRKEKANDQIEKFYEIFRDLSFEISFTSLMLMLKLVRLKNLDWKQGKLSELLSLSLPELTPTCMTLELADRSITETNRPPSPYSRAIVSCEQVYALIDVYEARLPSCGKETIHSTGPSFKIHQLINYHMTVKQNRLTFLIFEEEDSFLALEDDPTSLKMIQIFQVLRGHHDSRSIFEL
ncbi:hypothetical protein Tco_0340850 [Tanacetum coccineum]